MRYVIKDLSRIYKELIKLINKKTKQLNLKKMGKRPERHLARKHAEMVNKHIKRCFTSSIRSLSKLISGTAELSSSRMSSLIYYLYFPEL